MRRGYSSSDRRVSDLRPPCACVCHRAPNPLVVRDVAHQPGRCFCLCTCSRTYAHIRLTNADCPLHGDEAVTTT